MVQGYATGQVCEDGTTAVVDGKEEISLRIES
jgi:hypothetical protein